MIVAHQAGGYSVLYNFGSTRGVIPNIPMQQTKGKIYGLMQAGGRCLLRPRNRGISSTFFCPYQISTRSMYNRTSTCSPISRRNRILGEAAKLEFRVDAYNLFNLLNFNPTTIVNDINASGFGPSAVGSRGSYCDAHGEVQLLARNLQPPLGAEFGIRRVSLYPF